MIPSMEMVFEAFADANSSHDIQGQVCVKAFK
jgi:hypothetical protein